MKKLFSLVLMLCLFGSMSIQPASASDFNPTDVITASMSIDYSQPAISNDGCPGDGSINIDHSACIQTLQISCSGSSGPVFDVGVPLFTVSTDGAWSIRGPPPYQRRLS